MPPREDFDNSKIIYYVLIAIVLIAFIALNYYNFRKHVSSNSQTINQYTKPKEHIERKPAVAGLFYSEDKVKLDKEVNHYLSVDFQNSEHQPQMLIVPHAGYEYSAATAAKAYAQLQKYANKIKRVVLVGPSHKVVFDGIATSGNDSFVTPLGRVPVNKTMVKNVTKNGDIIIFEGAHAREHSIEVQLPFLQKVLKKFSILPLVYSNVTPEELAEELKPFLGRQDTVIVFSADLSHYLDYDTAQKVDNHTANMIAKKNADISYDMSCGATGINAALILAKRNSLHPELLDLRNSGDAKGGKTQVVGYGSWMFTSGENTEVEEELTPIEQEEKNIKDFISLHKKEIIDIARKSLEEAVLHDSSY
ncbi:MAG: AmmeMemoRadiSam system protein B, partial [Lactobacillus sp.]|nr:AmmeMemoRadiSam system protein B [Lactobacillus sp.]